VGQRAGIIIEIAVIFYSTYPLLLTEASRYTPETKMNLEFTKLLKENRSRGQISRYNDWLQAGRPKGRSASHGSVKNCLFFTSSRPDLGPPSLLSNGYRRVQLPEREHDSPPTNVEVKKTWIIHLLPIRLH
jgi:hypothetical protein